MRLRLRAGWRALRVQLLASLLLIGLVPIGLLGWFMLDTLDRYYQKRLLDDLQSEAALIGDAITPDLRDGQVVPVEALVANPPLPMRTQARVVVFDGTGQVIASAGAQVAPKNDEPGLSDALAGRLARGVEQSPALAAPIAFAAQPLTTAGRVIGVVHIAYALADLQGELSGLRTTIGLAMAGLALLAVMVSLELSRRLNTPLDRLRAATQDIAAGNFDHRVAEEGPAELAEVAHNFNRMAEDLQRTERQRQTLFANLAHDVRTPLGSIRAAAEALESGAYEQPELRARLISGLIAQTGYLRRLTDDLLRLATYEGGGITLRLQRVGAPELLQQAAQAIAPAALDRGVEIGVADPAPVGDVRVDPDRILEVFLNLLDNALQYTPRGGRVTLSAEAERGRVVFHVTDTGSGLPIGEEASIFERHRRGSVRREGSGSNTGLGLSIASALIASHGGEITARNRPAGGADFVFWLPNA